MFKPFPRGLAAFALAGTLTLSACDSTEPGGGPGEEELITEVTLTLTDSDGNDVTITGSDPEGAGLTFSPASVALQAGTSYTGTIEFDAPGESVTEEIEEEAEEHRIAYSLEPGGVGTVTVTDRESDYTSDDENGGDFVVGLRFRVDVAAGASGSGTMRAILYHFDDEPKTSDTATSDEIDIEVPFPVTVQ